MSYAENAPIAAEYPLLPTAAETDERHRMVIEQYDIDLGGKRNLDEALATFDPTVELVVRGRYGLYPFGGPQTDEAIADRLAIRPITVASNYETASASLRGGYYAKQRTLADAVGMETLARALVHEDCPLSEHDRILLARIRGIPPFARPTSVLEIAQEHDMIESTLRRRARRMMRQACLGLPFFIGQSQTLTESRRTPRPEPVMPVERNSNLRAQLQRRDAGIYAGMLRAFSLAETRSEWERILTQDLGRAATYRSRTRKFWNAGIPLNFLNTEGRERTELPALTAKQAFNVALDTPAGHHNLVADVARRASQLTSADLDDLQLVVEDGRQAQEEILTANILLTFFTANAVRRRTGANTLNKEMLGVAYEGLQHAVQRFDGEVEAKFSTYAIKIIGGYVLHQLDRRLAQDRNLSIHNVRLMRRIYKAEQQLKQEHGGMPKDIDALLAVRLGCSEKVIRKKRLLWVGSKPLSINQTVHFANSDGFELERIIAAPDLAAQQEQTAETASALRQSFQEIFTVLGTKEVDKRVLFRLYGIDCPLQSPSEVARDLGLAEYDVQKLARTTKRAIRNSAEAGKIFGDFLRKTI